MSTFTIDSDNNIAVCAEAPASTDNLETFASERELAKLATEWPGSRLVEVWNSFAGVTPFDDLKPVKKFTSRKLALARIWAAVQRLSPDGTPQASNVAPAKGKSKKPAPQPTKRARAQKGVTERTNKKAEVIALMKRAKGATLPEWKRRVGRSTPFAAS